jgi:hypothetical protein
MRGVLVVQLGLACGVALAGGCGGTSADVGQSGGTGGTAASSGGTDGGGTDSSGDGTGATECVAGTERCHCYEDATCNEGLVCASDLCVDLGGGGLSGAAGSAGGEGSCTNVTPCGGDVVGTWTVVSSCLTVSGGVDLSNYGLGCVSAPVMGSLRVSGSWTANADGTYSDNTTTQGNVQIDFGCDCRGGAGTCTTCPRFGALLTSPGYAAVTCADATGSDAEICECGPGCTCTATIDQAGGIGVAPMYPSATGTYTTSGTVLTMTAGEQEYSYCVSGDTLTLTPQSTPTTGTLTGTVVLQRQ